MNTVRLLETMRDVLAADPAIAEWCMLEFGKPPMVFLEIDQANPPQAEDYPLIAILGVRQMRGDRLDKMEWEVDVGVGVIQPEVIISGSTRTFKGMLQAETLREHAENALYQARVSSLGSSGESMSDSMFPIFMSFTTVTVQAMKSNRRGLP